MKKALLAGVLFISLPLTAFGASFDTDLKYGSKGEEVIALQEFLTDQGCYKGPITGNFYSLTLAGAKCFQKAQGISPVSGYIGPITRGVINKILTTQAPDSEGDATTSNVPTDYSVVPVPTPVVNPPTTVIPAPQTQVAPVVQELPAPQILNTSVTRVGEEVTLTFSTDIAADTLFKINTTNSVGGGLNGSDTSRTDHSFKTELGPGVYYYSIEATANGKTTTKTGSIPR